MIEKIRIPNIYVRGLMVRRFWITFSLDIFVIILFYLDFILFLSELMLTEKNSLKFMYILKNSFFAVDLPKVIKKIDLKNEQTFVKMDKTTSKM